MLKFFFPLLRKKLKKRRTLLRSDGEHYDLKGIYDRINTEYFENSLNLNITWFGNKHRVPRSSVRLGSYNPNTKIIKIHRLLDRKQIPGYFVSFVIYHEMLHHILPPVKLGGRRQIHHAEFKKREKQFQDYALSKNFSQDLRKNLFQ